MSSYLDSATLADLQTETDLTLTATAQIGRRTQVSNGRGGYTTAWPPVAGAAGTFPCRLVPFTRMPPSMVVGGQLQDRVLYQVTYPITVGSAADVLQPNLVWFTVGDHLTVGGLVYEVQGIDDASTNAFDQHAVVWRKET